MPRVILIGMTVVGLIVLALVGSFVFWRWNLRREVNARVAAIRAAGEPVNWEELEKWPEEVPDLENGALVFTNVLAHLVRDGLTDNSRFDLPRHSGDISNKLRASIIVAVTTNHEALNLLDKAVGFQRFRYPVDYTNGPNAKLRHLGDLNQVVRLLECEAFLKSEIGDMHSAGKAVEKSIRVARSLDAEPILISQLTAGNQLRMSCYSLECVLSRGSLADEQLAGIEKQIVEAEATNRFVLGLIGERAMNGELIRLAQDDVRRMIDISNQGVGQGDKIEPPRLNPGIGWRFLGFFERDRNFYLRAMETNILVMAVGPPTSLSLSNTTADLAAQSTKGFYIFSAMLLPGMSRMPERDASIRAMLRAAVAGVVVERWRLAHNGETPDSLNALVPTFLPAVPLDPYDGRPLRFKKLPRGYVVYSIGPDRRDDGGKPRLPASANAPFSQRNSYDITFTVER